MFNQTNLIIGSIYSIAFVTGGMIGLGILKLTQNEARIEEAAANRATRSMDDYLQGVYRKRVERMLEIIDTADISDDTTDELRDLVDCPPSEIPI